MSEPQIQRKRHNVDAKRRAWLQAFGHRRERDLAAILAMPSEAFDTRHYRLDWRQVDLVVTGGEFEVGFKKRRETLCAAYRPSDNRLVGVSLQSTPAAFAPDAAFAWAFAFGFLIDVGFLALRRWQARIVGGLGWPAQPGFQLSHAKC